MGRKAFKRHILSTTNAEAARAHSIRGGPRCPLRRLQRRDRRPRGARPDRERPGTVLAAVRDARPQTRPAARTLAGLGLTPVVGDLDDAASLAALAAGRLRRVLRARHVGRREKIDEREVPRARRSPRPSRRRQRRPSSSTTRRPRPTIRASPASSRSTPSRKS